MAFQEEFQALSSNTYLDVGTTEGILENRNSEGLYPINFKYFLTKYQRVFQVEIEFRNRRFPSSKK